MTESSGILPQLAALTIKKNPLGWGPMDIPDEFKSMPYQPFSKDTRLGKIADWSGNVYQDMKYKNRYQSQFGGGGQYAYYHDDDDANFQTVGATAKTKQTAFLKTRQRIITRKQRGGMPYNQQRQPQSNQPLTAQQKRVRQIAANSFQGRKPYFRGQDNRNRAPRVIREPLIAIQSFWPAIDEIDLNRLNSLSLPNLPKPVDLADFGELGYFDPSLDRINTKNDMPITGQTEIALSYNPLAGDSVVVELIKSKLGNVFITSQAAALLMCCPRSVYSWDLVAHRADDSILIDFRENYDDVNIDPLTMNETAQEPPPENMVKIFSYECAISTKLFRKACLQSGPKAPKFSFPQAIPQDDEEDVPQGGKKAFHSFGFRYRLFDIGNGWKVVIRCEVDAVVAGSKKSDRKFACVYALNECPVKAPGSVDWRSKLDTQAGAVLASELKNNSFKLARYTTRAILSDAQFIKLGFISRINPKDTSKHTILGVQQFKTPEFAQQIGFNMDNAWALLRCIIEHVFKMPVGTYLIQKDANKPILRFHTLPADEMFEEDETLAEMDEEQLKAHREQMTKEAEERLQKVNEALGTNKLGFVQSGTL